MNRQEAKSTVTKKGIPDSPGVYLFKQNKVILYIGKATSLKDRIKSYFSNDLIETRGMLLVDMVSKTNDIDFIKTDSVLEAFILENELIKKHQPHYNLKEKDDKSFNYVVITKEKFPRVLIERGRNLEKENWESLNKKKYSHIFGPYPYAPQLREALKLIRKIFPFHDVCKLDQPRPCFNYSIGLCPGVCGGKMTAKEYSQTIRHLVLFFQGKKKSLIQVLKQEMKAYSKQLNFEKCAEIKKTIEALGHIQDISMIKKEPTPDVGEDGKILPKTYNRIEAYDIAHMSGQNMVGVMVVMNDGEFDKNEYRKFVIKTFAGSNDTGALREILVRRFAHTEWPTPSFVVIDGGVAQINVAKENVPAGVKIVSVVKDSRHKAREILMADLTNDSVKSVEKIKSDIIRLNAEAHRFAITYHRKKRARLF